VGCGGRCAPRGSRFIASSAIPVPLGVAAFVLIAIAVVVAVVAGIAMCRLARLQDAVVHAPLMVDAAFSERDSAHPESESFCGGCS
jgi:hypothetical protein